MTTHSTHSRRSSFPRHKLNSGDGQTPGGAPKVDLCRKLRTKRKNDPKSRDVPKHTGTYRGQNTLARKAKNPKKSKDATYIQQRTAPALLWRWRGQEKAASIISYLLALFVATSHSVYQRLGSRTVLLLFAATVLSKEILSRDGHFTLFKKTAHCLFEKDSHHFFCFHSYLSLNQ
jgi:hypothetical protein